MVPMVYDTYKILLVPKYSWGETRPTHNWGSTGMLTSNFWGKRNGRCAVEGAKLGVGEAKQSKATQKNYSNSQWTPTYVLIEIHYHS
jgi:hypothetical protein